MKKLTLGLVIEGNSTSSALLRLPALAAELGPVKSSGLPTARRVSNFLKGGYGVASYSDLASARIILIRVPDSATDRVISEICDAGLVWPDHSFVLCETWLPTEKLEPLRRLGAGIASLVALPSWSEKIFALEGDVTVVRQMRRLLRHATVDHAGIRALELRAGSKHLLFAAAALCNAVPIPLLLASQQLLRESGLSGNQLLALIEHMSNEMVASFLKGARAPWGGAFADLLKTTRGDHWDHLDVTHPETAAMLRQLLKLIQVSPKRARVQSA